MYTLINLSAAELMLCLFEKLGPLLERPLNMMQSIKQSANQEAQQRCILSLSYSTYCVRIYIVRLLYTQLETNFVNNL